MDLFYVSPDGTEYSYSQLVSDISDYSEVYEYCYQSTTYEIFKHLISNIVARINVTLLDSDFSKAEMQSLGIDYNDISKYYRVDNSRIKRFDDILDDMRGRQDWRLTLFTSGTTGLPKKVTHNLVSLLRMVKETNRHRNDVWGFAYNPTHIAGIQVFLQALMNRNTIIDCFGMSKEHVLDRIDQYQITNISATPTFYRMLIPIEGEHTSIQNLTSGGERFDSSLMQKLKDGFPNARLTNIYASTEAGSVLVSRNDRFTIPDSEKCMIKDDTLHISRSELGFEDNGEKWYNTGDLVKIVDALKGEFIFVSRDNDMINVGGYKANPVEIEEALCSHPAVIKSRVWGKPNSIMGNIIMAEVICTGQCSENELREFLRSTLQDYKIPRFISFVSDIATTRSGKIKRG